MIAAVIELALAALLVYVGRRAYLDAKEADRREALRGRPFDPWED